MRMAHGFDQEVYETCKVDQEEGTRDGYAAGSAAGTTTKADCIAIPQLIESLRQAGLTCDPGKQTQPEIQSQIARKARKAKMARGDCYRSPTAQTHHQGMWVAGLP